MWTPEFEKDEKYEPVDLHDMRKYGGVGNMPLLVPKSVSSSQILKGYVMDV